MKILFHGSNVGIEEIDLYCIETMTTDLALLVMDDLHVGLETALELVFNSDTYVKVCDPRLPLMYQHPNYVYIRLLRKELTDTSPR